MSKDKDSQESRDAGGLPVNRRNVVGVGLAGAVGILAGPAFASEDDFSRFFNALTQSQAFAQIIQRGDSEEIKQALETLGISWTDDIIAKIQQINVDNAITEATWNDLADLWGHEGSSSQFN